MLLDMSHVFPRKLNEITRQLNLPGWLLSTSTLVDAVLRLTQGVLTLKDNETSDSMSSESSTCGYTILALVPSMEKILGVR